MSSLHLRRVAPTHWLSGIFRAVTTVLTAAAIGAAVLLWLVARGRSRPVAGRQA